MSLSIHLHGLHLDARYHHHFICPIIQQYAHLHEYDSRRAGQQGPTRTLTAALKRVIKTVTGYIFYHTGKILQMRKLENSIFSMLFLKKHLKMYMTVAVTINTTVSVGQTWHLSTQLLSGERTTVMYSLGHGLRTLTELPRSTQPCIPPGSTTLLSLTLLTDSQVSISLVIHGL